MQIKDERGIVIFCKKCGSPDLMETNLDIVCPFCAHIEMKKKSQFNTEEDRDECEKIDGEGFLRIGYKRKKR